MPDTRKGPVRPLRCFANAATRGAQDAGRLVQLDLPDTKGGVYSLEAIYRSADDGNLIEFLETDRKFHVGLIATLGNKPLADLVETLRDRVRLPGSRIIRPENISRSRPASIFSYSTLSKRDEAGAVAVMRRHLERSRHVWSQSDHTAHS